MAFKIKDNLDLYGNQLLNFALQSDSGFPQSPQVGHMFNYTGTGVMANHAVMCVDETTKAFKALAFVDEIATNAEFVELKEKVDLLIGDDVDTDTIIDSWKEVQAFLADIENTKTLQGMLSSYLPKSGGTITGTLTVNDTLISKDYIKFNRLSDGKQYLLGQPYGEEDPSLSFYIGGAWNRLLHAGNYSDYAYPKDGKGQLSFDANGRPVMSNNQGYSAKNTSGKSEEILWLDASNITMVGGTTSQKVRLYDYNPTCLSGALIHSGNIGSQIVEGVTTHTDKAINASGDITKLNSYYSSEGFRISRFDGLNGLGTKNSDGLIVNWPLDHSYGQQWYMDDESHIIQVRYVANEVWSNWKTIAFTDSDITGNAAGLKHSNGTVGATVKSNGDVDFAKNILLMGSIVKYNDNNVAYFGSAQDGLGESYDGALMYAYGQRNLYFYTGKDIRMLINSSGNVTIGAEDKAGTNAKLYVDGNARIKGSIILNRTRDNSEAYMIRGVDGSNDLEIATLGGTGAIVFKTNSTGSASEKMRVAGNGNVGIGTTDPKKKLHVVGDLYVDGNIIATKEVSAGGAGQEGESGDGGAEVISQQLASGQSTYTITNTIKRSDIAVSLYEWNANNGSWDMCLADISVKDATITVTFGSATSVNHKLVAVG